MSLMMELRMSTSNTFRPLQRSLILALTFTVGWTLDSRAEDSLSNIPRIDAHAHCGIQERMERYVQIAGVLKERHGQDLVAWVDLNFLRGGKTTADEYFQLVSEKYDDRFLPCLHELMRDGFQYRPEELAEWKNRGVAGVKIWVGLSDAIARPENEAFLAKMEEIGMPGASIHIAQPYPTSWCNDPIQFWRAQKAWERVLDRHPNLIVVNAHMLDHFNSDEQLDYLDYMLTTYPRLHVDLSARFQQFHRMKRDKLREFMIRHQDRILFGTDIGKAQATTEQMAERYHRCFTMLETDRIVRGSFFEEESVSQGLALPRAALEKIYYRNAVRIYPRLAEILSKHGHHAAQNSKDGS
jgi:predicted TIM-barrel fold metal-dependent hydrolase